MGVLTNDMTRLCGEMAGLRGARRALINDLSHMTRERRAAVARMQTGFRRSHTEMSRKAKADLRAFMSALRRTVSALRREVADDIAGASRAWSGKH